MNKLYCVAFALALTACQEKSPVPTPTHDKCGQEDLTRNKPQGTWSKGLDAAWTEHQLTQTNTILACVRQQLTAQDESKPVVFGWDQGRWSEKETGEYRFLHMVNDDQSPISAQMEVRIKPNAGHSPGHVHNVGLTIRQQSAPSAKGPSWIIAHLTLNTIELRYFNNGLYSIKLPLTTARTVLTDPKAFADAVVFMPFSRQIGAELADVNTGWDKRCSAGCGCESVLRSEESRRERREQLLQLSSRTADMTDQSFARTTAIIKQFFQQAHTLYPFSNGACWPQPDPNAVPELGPSPDNDDDNEDDD